MQHRYSALKDINTDNVKDLQFAWAQSTGALRGHEGQPLVINDVGGKPMMFIVSRLSGHVELQHRAGAGSVRSGPSEAGVELREDQTDRDESAVPRACCDTVNRGLNYADGKLVFGTLDGYRHRARCADRQRSLGRQARLSGQGRDDHARRRSSPNDKVMIGFGGDEFAARGRFTAYALADGKKVWECHVDRFRQRRLPDRRTPTRSNPQYGTAGKDLGISYVSGRRVAASAAARLGLVQLRPRAATRLLRRPATRVCGARPSAAAPRPQTRKLQQRQVGQQMVDDDLRAQRRYRRSRLGLSDDAVRPVGL